MELPPTVRLEFHRAAELNHRRSQPGFAPVGLYLFKVGLVSRGTHPAIVQINLFDNVQYWTAIPPDSAYSNT
jgi:hypothetical protein